ncbi:hypothetical protein A3A84_01570 [Candidatus Collierbacteria bacterium RIFCSPLOWO2_01_FULL_50_23]|uniref:Uncharacterized protein n=2 Tax=Candidatus Collieribacteriota TaxID=1752725 RepID=A0A1F5EXW0_9BACT|nr:MAG: hypothetical protein A2703_00530 [Candidatus Collierbacteria bacterium RIFCSPHIGHO2_01_FULL_50_25]OGD72207.1 MAG: hypothetical protein A3D09_01680 [Candidatus Collierbacteria bacterium RIFCSPHIGHO2_02_FULL_49_10]OGD74903.1 MAG: hypothetical protein A3A84_01570 [Candidatus Collierbacteria bacterium RIFCSPLOWO2_01_FULL_50_23]
MFNKETKRSEGTILRGLLGVTTDGKKIYLEFSPEHHFFGRVFVEGEEYGSRIDFGKQIFLDEPVGGLDASDVVLKAAEMMEKWERKAALAEASTSELLLALWESLTIRS